jgi:hypothetical protein
MATSDPFPREAGRLDPGSRFFLWSFRHWIGGHFDERHWTLVSRAFERVSGRVVAGEGLTALAALVRAICEHARRNFTYHQPCCSCLAADEYRLVTFLTACRNRQWVQASGLAEWIVRADGVAALIASGTRLGRLIDEEPALADALPAYEGDDAPHRLDDAERPSALQEAVDRSQRAGGGEAEHEPRAALLECVADDHRRDGEQAEGV